MRKPAFCICEKTKTQIVKLISAFVFARLIVQSLYFLNPKFQASSQVGNQNVGFLMTRQNYVHKKGC